jgi:signal transduction histidine kinase
MKNSLRNRFALTFALFASLVSMVLAAIIYLASHNLEAQLIRDTLNAELDDYIERRARNPLSRPEHTATISAYVITNDASMDSVPADIAVLRPGYHEVTLDRIDYVAGVREVNDQRFVVLYNISALQQREKGYVLLLIFSVLVVTMASALAGRWLAARSIAPVTELARKVTQRHPEDELTPLANEFSWIEVKQLALDFDVYLKRLHDFIERERLLTGDISHELRTPISVIQGTCELLLEQTSDNQKIQQHTLRISRAASEMGEISTALLALAREQGEANRSVELSPVNEVVEEVVGRYRQLFRNKPVDLRLDITDVPERPVDHAMLLMVLGNLVRNSLSFTEQGEVLVTLNRNGITVEDTGPGLGEKPASELFSSYVRGSQSAGAGLGLALVHRLCEHEGWSISISNRPAGGTLAQLDLYPAISATE